MAKNSRILGGSMLTRSVGTRMYASPEQLESSKYDFKSDIYSLGIILVRIFTPTYTQMETIRLIEKLRSGQFSDSFTDYLDVAGPVINKALNVDSKNRPELEEIEKALAIQCIKTFKELRFDHNSASYSVFKENSGIKIGLTMSLFAVSMVIEGEQSQRPAILMLRNNEVLIFFENEVKSKLSFSPKDYTFFTHKKRRIVSLKSSIKSELTLIFQSLDDLEMFLTFSEEQGTIVY